MENHDDWTISFDFITLPQFIIGSDEIELYLEVSPENVDYNLDNVILEIVDEGNWVEEVKQGADIDNFFCISNNEKFSVK